MRTILIGALAALVFEAGAQTPPVPPAPPVQPAPAPLPAPAARPAPPLPPDVAMPVAPPAPPHARRPEVGDLVNEAFRLRDFDFNFDFDRARHFEAAQHALEMTRLDHAAIAPSFDRDAIRESSLRALEMSRIDMEEARLAMDLAMADVALAPHALSELSLYGPARAPRAYSDAMMAERIAHRAPVLQVVPRESWLSQDPADSLYRAARDLTNRGQYRSAAETFRAISQRYPSSGYTPDAMYWEAYSLYRIGGQNELRQALAVLDRQKARFPNANLPDPGLLPRIQGELARGGDANAAAYVASTASRPGQSCNKDDMAVRLEALNALSRMNIDSTTPILRRVLARRDECSVSLRRQAITLMAKNQDASTTEIMLDVVKNDPAPEVRRAAVSWLGEVPSDRSAAALDEILRSQTERDVELHSHALRALSSSRNPRAAQALRTVIERRDVSENLRREAMSNLTRIDSVGAGAYLRTLFPKLESRQMKTHALTQIARIRGDDNQKWLLAFVRDTTEPVDLRKSALSTLTRSTTTSIADVGGLFKSVPEFELRQQIITSLASRKEPEAVDQLISIYRASTDPKLNVQIINVLSRRDDPRTLKLLAEILK